MSHRIEYVEPTRQRRPRVEEPKHLNLIRQLKCVICGARPVEAAHIRSPALKYGKRHTGTAEKSSDKWTLPLCPHHHREQHSKSELEFYRHYGINPCATALALWAAEDDPQMMEIIINMARSQ